MAQEQKKHLGQNVRDLRVLKGMKQETLGRAIGMAQQNVSKMEKNESPTDEVLERIAKVMGVTINDIKNFDKNSGMYLYFYTQEQNNHPIKEVIAYFKEELLNEFNKNQELKDENEALKAELEALKDGKPQSAAPAQPAKAKTPTATKKQTANVAKGKQPAAGGSNLRAVGK